MNLRVKQFIDVYIGKTILLFNLIAVRGIGLILRRNHDLNVAPENILVIKILGLGSVIMASDSIYSVKQKYPHARLILLCGNGVKAGIEPIELFDEIKVIDDRSFFAMAASSIRILWQCFRMKKLWVMDLEIYSVLTTVFSSWTCAINRFGFQLDKTTFRNYLNTHNIYFNQFIRVGINYNNLAMAMGVKTINQFRFPEKFQSAAASKNYIVINNTCSELGGNLRKIPAHSLRKICEYIISNTAYKIAFTGAPGDKNEIDDFITSSHLISDRVENIAGRFSFNDYYNFIGTEAKCMLSIDSAPLHISMKLNVPNVSLWGPINPAQRLDDISNTYYLGKLCSPCIHHTEVIPCGGNNICMKDMDTAQITSLLKRVI